MDTFPFLDIRRSGIQIKSASILPNGYTTITIIGTPFDLIFIIICIRVQRNSTLIKLIASG